MLHLGAAPAPTLSAQVPPSPTGSPYAQIGLAAAEAAALQSPAKDQPRKKEPMSATSTSRSRLPLPSTERAPLLRHPTYTIRERSGYADVYFQPDQSRSNIPFRRALMDQAIKLAAGSGIGRCVDFDATQE